MRARNFLQNGTHEKLLEGFINLSYVTTKHSEYLQAFKSTTEALHLYICFKA